MSKALLVQSQNALVAQLAEAGDKPVVVGFTLMTSIKFATMYAQVVTESPSTVVFLLVMVDTGAAAKEIADTNGVAALPSFLYFQNKEKVTSFSSPEAQKVMDTLEAKVKECQ